MSIDGGLRAMFHKRLSTGDWQAIETGGTGRGIPDSNFCFPGGVEGWVEFKQTSGYKVKVWPEQVAWIERRLRKGGRVFVAVRRRCEAGVRREKVDILHVFRGAAIRGLAHDGLGESVERHRIYTGHGGPANWDWTSVQYALISDTK
jgi:hypothetical protein